jgi:hypothetical protein
MGMRYRESLTFHGIPAPSLRFCRPTKTDYARHLLLSRRDSMVESRLGASTDAARRPVSVLQRARQTPPTDSASARRVGGLLSGSRPGLFPAACAEVFLDPSDPREHHKIVYMEVIVGVCRPFLCVSLGTTSHGCGFWCKQVPIADDGRMEPFGPAKHDSRDGISTDRSSSCVSAGIRVSS